MAGWGEQMDEKLRQIREDPEAFYARQREAYRRAQESRFRAWLSRRRFWVQAARNGWL